jgi:transposase InsO family protein
LSVARGCQLLGISRQAWYQQFARQRQRQREAHAQVLVDAVLRERSLQPCIGTRKLQRLLQKSGLAIGRDRLFALLREHRLLVPTRRAYHKTTHSHHRFRKHPNLLKPGEHQVIPQRPEQVWVADITYLPVHQGEAYLSLVTDAYSRKIVGHYVHDNLKTESVIGAYQQALRARQYADELIHHSDRGIQYCSAQYQALHDQHGVRCSMTDGYDCYQNALAERVNGILKNEFLIRKPKDIAEAKAMVAESIRIYNERRPHLSLQYKTPDEVHRAFC